MLKHLISISALVVVASGACFDNGDKEIGGACYKFVAQKLSFADARNWCHYQNPVTASYLASVSNQFTANFLASYARSAFGQNDGYFWIGLSRNKTYTPWTWDTGYQMQWSNFDSDQLSYNYAAENIVNSKWRTFAAEEQMNFVCSYDPTSPPTFAPPTSDGPSTPTPTPTAPQTTTQTVPTTTEDFGEFCNIGEKHSTFLLAYAADFDVATYNRIVTNVVIPTISANRHNYTKLARVRFDTIVAENITYHDDVSSFQNGLNSNPPTAALAADSSYPSVVKSVITSFLHATGRPLESSMVILLVQRFPIIGVDISQAEYDMITNNNVKIFPIVTSDSYAKEFDKSARSYQPLASWASNSNGHFVVGATQIPLQYCLELIMGAAYTKSLAFTRNVGQKWIAAGNNTNLGTMKVPRSRLGYVRYQVTFSVETQQKQELNAGEIRMIISQPGSEDQVIDDKNSMANTNVYYGNIQLRPGVDSTISLDTKINGSHVFVRFWTESVTYHYGSYTAIDDPMGNFALPSVDEYNGATLRMKIMNDCYTDFAGSIIISDCNGVVSTKYDSIQNIPSEYIFADEGSFPHYPFVPFFCDSIPKNNDTCVGGAQSKYDIQFVASEFTVIRSFQCRPGVGTINPKCQNVDANGNYYCNRDSVPYKRGPTGQLTDCLGHGHLEFDFDDTQSYICVCDAGFTGDSCEQKM